MGRRFDPDRAHVSRNAYSSSELSFFALITHFVPPNQLPHHFVRDFIRLRANWQYFRSYGRLLKYGSRGATPWKLDDMTKIRRENQNERRRHLYLVIRELLSLKVKSIQIHIHTNSSIEADRIAAEFGNHEIVFHIFPEYSRMNVIHNSPWIESDLKNPWRLTWRHRPTLKDLVEKSKGKNLYLYIENDLLFTQRNLDYWLKSRPLLQPSGFIPSFLRVEQSHSRNCWFPMDNLVNERIRVNALEVDGMRRYAQLPNTYAGCFLLDDELAREFIKSDSFDLEKSKSRTWWDIGARATAGLQFENVPAGAKSRYLLPLEGNGVAKDAWIHHLPNLYIRRFGHEGKLPADDFLLT